MVGVPGSGKTTRAREMLLKHSDAYPGRRSLHETNGKYFYIKLIFRENLSTFLSLFFYGIVALWHTVCFALNLNSTVNERLKRSSIFLVLLVRSRLFNLSRRMWIIDQGLLQHIQSCLAIDILSKNSAKRWCKFIIHNNSIAPFKIETLVIDTPVLFERINKSTKHLDQLNGLSIEEYIRKNVKAFKTLFENGELKDTD